MSDEPETPDEGENDLEHHEIDQRLFFNGEPDLDLLEYVRDNVLTVPFVLGDKPPNWTNEAGNCVNGCCVKLWLKDTANEHDYLVASGPSFMAQLQGWVDFNGNVNPLLARTEALKHQSLLN